MVARYLLNRTSGTAIRNHFQLPLIHPQLQIRLYHKKVKRSLPFIPPRSQIQSNTSAIASRGFLRPLKEYDPPIDIRDTIKKLAESTINQTNLSYKLDTNEKISLLKKCEQMVDHRVPNSLLHTVNTLGEIYEFYETPVDTVVPYDALQKRELPPNLHILSDYHRFHPETDMMFEGVSAFPETSTLVTGLKTKKKYKGFSAPRSPYYYKD
ncbi:uncharacterized protein LOC126841388 [Adelges cooleyi]|uniref:uncharacterized protein LOC126841388 n=1 Tax=Adelges cooleyi TaxID=133065 RepID=UPI00217F2991|nr:uncharacterized protein LOC126841388 [Adelges cooleyi]